MAVRKTARKVDIQTVFTHRLKTIEDATKFAQRKVRSDYDMVCIAWDDRDEHFGARWLVVFCLFD